MATNKNQHFVPRCYLRSFTVNSDNKEINLYNIDRKRFVQGAPVKHQCSKDYFYGEDNKLEKALQFTEGSYATVLRDLLSPGYHLTDDHRQFFRYFWLLQHLRTESASKRALEMSEGMRDVAGIEAHEFRMSIKEAVLNAMHTFVQEMHIVDDLKVCLLKNRTSIPFFTSDDPAVLTNRWHLVDRRTIGSSFGLNSAGNILILPLSPRVLCLGYDGSVYNVPHKNGWSDIRHETDIHALNQHQFMNCRANIFIHDAEYSQIAHDSFISVETLRPNERHRIHYAVLDKEDGEHKRYRVIKRDEAGEHKEAIIHSQTVHAHPSAWPKQILWRKKGFVFTNGTGVGYVRKAYVESKIYDGFRKELAR